MTEQDPNGLSANTPGAKLDQGKPLANVVLAAFAPALAEVVAVGTFGAHKYTQDGWLSVPNGQARYSDAMLRHWLDEARGERIDPQSGLLHAAHTAWNALARLTLLVRNQRRETSLDDFLSSLPAEVQPTEADRQWAKQAMPSIRAQIERGLTELDSECLADLLHMHAKGAALAPEVLHQAADRLRAQAYELTSVGAGGVQALRPATRTCSGNACSGCKKVVAA